MKHNDDVIDKFEKEIKSSPSIYDDEDVANGRKMLNCSVHCEKLCRDNEIFLKKSLSTAKTSSKLETVMKKNEEKEEVKQKNLSI